MHTINSHLFILGYRKTYAAIKIKAFWEEMSILEVKSTINLNLLYIVNVYKIEINYKFIIFYFILIGLKF